METWGRKNRTWRGGGANSHPFGSNMYRDGYEKKVPTNPTVGNSVGPYELPGSVAVPGGGCLVLLLYFSV